jgi:hypothetical protein
MPHAQTSVRFRFINDNIGSVRVLVQKRTYLPRIESNAFVILIPNIGR